MNVLSLFDGMSCGQIALNRIGIKYDNYFASEIDKYAIKVTQHNYPNTIQLGSVTDIEPETLPKIDLLIGGSPCQSFSFAGKRKGMSTVDNVEIVTLEHYLDLKQNGFQFNGQSYLFWEYVRILKEINPKYFLLENVRMAKKWKDIISKTLDIDPIEINSALVSAQNRKRLYWTNISNVEQPIDKNIVLNNILNIYSGNLTDEYIEHKINQKRFGNHIGSIYDNKHHCLLAIGKSDTLLLKEYRRYIDTIECERLQTVPDNYTSIVADTHRYKMLGNGWTIDVIAHILKNIEGKL